MVWHSNSEHEMCATDQSVLQREIAALMEQIQVAEQELSQTPASDAVETNVRREAEAVPSSQRSDCIICLTPRERTVLYLPCRHALVCEGCDARIAVGSPCPSCRSSIVEKIRIFDT